MSIAMKYQRPVSEIDRRPSPIMTYPISCASAIPANVVCNRKTDKYDVGHGFDNEL